MGNRIVIGLAALAAIVGGVAPDLIPGEALPLILVVLGLVYGYMGVDAEDATAYLAVAIAVAAAASADVLGGIPGVGEALNGIMDGVSTVLLSGVATILGVRTWNRLKG